jgi:DDE superfamily endonuclease
VDGVDFPIFEPQKFDRQWYSHKFKGPGIRYEVAVCIQTGDIVWVNGPYKCGKYPDVKIFKEGLMHHLAVGELVEADRGYRGRDVKARTPDDFVSQSDKRAKERARARHETVNRRLKQWRCMGQKWRHCRSKHKLAFGAVAVITQMAFESGERPFQCRY